MKERRLKRRTHYIHKLKYSTQERIVGAFVLVAIGILAWLLFASGKSLITFEEHITIYGQLETIQPVDRHTEIVVGGLSAGTIANVEITDENKVIVTMEILKRYRSLLRTDSVALLNTFNLAMIDKSVIEISIGSPEQPLLEDGSTIEIVESINIKNLLANLTPAIDSLVRTINKVDAILSTVNPEDVGGTIDRMNNLVAAVDPEKLKSMVNNLHDISNNVKDISNQVNAGKGLAGSVIYDEKLEHNTRQIAANMEIASASLSKLLDLLYTELEHLPAVLEKLEPLMQEADKTIKATQRIWPLSSAIEEEGEPEKLTPQAPAND